MTAALVDRLRALGPERARAVLGAVEADLGPAAIASLRYAPGFWLRPAQVVRPPYATIEVFKGERRTGKSHAARELFTTLLPLAPYPRIMVATDGAFEKTVLRGGSGFKQWTAPHIRCDFVKSTGYGGDLFYGPHTITVTLASAPVGSIGPGYGLTWADDPAAWVQALGAERSANAWNHLLKSNSDRPGIVIVSTTGAGVEFIWRLLDTKEHRHLLGSVRVHDLGTVENNAGNLAPSYLRDIVPGLRAANEWEEGGDPTGAFALLPWEKLRTSGYISGLVEIVVFVDPAKSSRSTSCEVGIVAVGIDGRGVVYGLADSSAVLSASRWPAVAHDLREKMEATYRGAAVHMGVENNAGGEMPAELLRAEEKIRRLSRGGRAVSMVEIREVTSRPRDSKVKRAGPIVALAKSDQVRMLEGLGILEGQLSHLTDAAPGNDRADAFVHGARDLAGLGEQAETPPPAPAVTFAGLLDAQRAFRPPAFTGGRV